MIVKRLIGFPKCSIYVWWYQMNQVIVCPCTPLRFFSVDLLDTSVAVWTVQQVNEKRCYHWVYVRNHTSSLTNRFGFAELLTWQWRIQLPQTAPPNGCGALSGAYRSTNRDKNTLNQGWAISGPRATCGPSQRLHWPAKTYWKNLKFPRTYHNHSNC